MPQDNLFEKELELSRQCAINISEKNIREPIEERIRALIHAEHMCEMEKQHILKDIERLITATRNKTLFTRITGKSPHAFFHDLEEKNGGTVCLANCLDKFNEALEKALQNKTINRVELAQIQQLKSFMAEIVSDLIALHESDESRAYWQTQTDHQKALDEIRTQTDRILDQNRSKPLHHNLQAVARHLHDTLGTKDIAVVGFSYVNEQNNHLQFDNLTRIAPDRTINEPDFFNSEEVEAADSFPEKIFSSRDNTSIYDPQRKTHFMGFRLGRQCLGILDIRFRNAKSRLLPEQEAICRNAITIMDTYLDGKLKQQRGLRHRRKVERILDRSGTDINFIDGRETGFRQGIIRALTYLCNKTGAKLIHLKLDVMGDEKSFPLELFIGQEGEIPADAFVSASENLTAKSHKITVPPGTVIDDDVKTVDNGTITFFGEDLDEEDRQNLEMTAEKLISAVRNWRNDLGNTINFGLPPKVALLRKKGLLLPMSVEDISMSYTDLHGFTAISERINEITCKFGLREDYMMRLIAAYDQMGKEIAEQSGGCFDKLVGDCLIIHAGPPYTTDGRDGLNMTELEPSFHAINCLKIALRIKHGLPRIQQFYERLLLEMANEIDDKSKSGPRSRMSADIKNTDEKKLDEFCATHNIPRILSVTQGISSGRATTGLVREQNSDKPTYSSSYTVIGDEMNIAARFQSNANPDEMIIGKRTKELIEIAINNNMSIPFGAGGENQNWEEFKRELLGKEYKKYDLIPIFEETMLNLKNKQGFEFAYRLSFEKVERIPPQMPEDLTEDELKMLPGYYKIISSDSKDRNLEVHLENMQTESELITAIIAKPPTETRLVTQKDYDRRVVENCDNILKIKNGKIIMVEYTPVDRIINRQLETLHDEARIYETSQIPHGIYAVKNRFPAQADSGGQAFTNIKPGTTVLEIERNGITLHVQVNDAEILELRDIKDRPKAKTLYDIHIYSHFKRIEQVNQNLRGFSSDSQKPTEILFIHSSGEYLGYPGNLESINPSGPPTLPSMR